MATIKERLDLCCTGNCPEALRCNDGSYELVEGRARFCLTHDEALKFAEWVLGHFASAEETTKP